MPTGIFNIFTKTKKRKRQNNDLPDGHFSLPDTVADDEDIVFKRNANSRSMRMRKDENFQRNGSIRRSLQNHRGILHIAHTFTSENANLRQEKEFLARRVECLEAQKKLEESRERPVSETTSLQEMQTLLCEKLELERKLKHSEQCRVEMEKCLTNECKRTAMLEESMTKTFHSLARCEQTTESTNHIVKEIKENLLASNDEYIRMLASVDKNTRSTLEKVNSICNLSSYIPTFNDSKFDRLPANVKETFNLLGEIVGVRWPQLVIALGLSPEVIEYFRSEEQNCGCSHNEIIWRILCIWYKKEGDVSLTKLEQSCLTLGVQIFIDKPMSQHQRIVLQNKYAELMEKMIDVWPVIPYLKKHSMIMPNVIEHIVTAKTRSDRIRRLIDSLVTLGEQGLPAFVRALDESGHQDLARGILAEEARLLSEALQFPPTVLNGQRQAYDTHGEGGTIPTPLKERHFAEFENRQACDLPLPEVDTENSYPIDTRYFSDLKATMKHVEAMLMEMAYKESLRHENVLK